jgi:hypothetical protein
MSFNSLAIAEFSKSHTGGLFIVFMDFDGDPVRVTSMPGLGAFSGTGDPDLDGFTYDYVDHELLTVSQVDHGIQGAGPLTVSMSGLPVANQGLIDILGDETKWRGRRVKLWMAPTDASGVVQGNIVNYYLGRMIGHEYPEIGRTTQQISIISESYAAIFSGATGKTYLMQQVFDPADLSARVAASTGRSKAAEMMVAAGAAQGSRSEINRNVRLL